MAADWRAQIEQRSSGEGVDPEGGGRRICEEEIETRKKRSELQIGEEVVGSAGEGAGLRQEEEIDFGRRRRRLQRGLHGGG